MARREKKPVHKEMCIRDRLHREDLDLIRLLSVSTTTRR